jgi:hypothetical protein
MVEVGDFLISYITRRLSQAELKYHFGKLIVYLQGPNILHTIATRLYACPGYDHVLRHWTTYTESRTLYFGTYSSKRIHVSLMPGFHIYW